MMVWCFQDAMKHGNRLNMRVMAVTSNTSVFRMTDVDNEDDPPEQSIDRLEGTCNMILLRVYIQLCHKVLMSVFFR